MNCKTRNRSAFTLIELLLVLVLLALLTTVSLPVLKGTFAGYEFSSTVSDVSKLIAFGREQAIITGQVFRLEVDSREHRYTLFQVQPSKGKESLESILIRSRRWPSRIEFNGHPKNEIVFYPDGSHTPFTFTFIRPNVRKATITSEGTLGRLVLKEESL